MIEFSAPKRLVSGLERAGAIGARLHLFGVEPPVDAAQQHVFVVLAEDFDDAACIVEGQQREQRRPPSLVTESPEDIISGVGAVDSFIWHWATMMHTRPPSRNDRALDRSWQKGAARRRGLGRGRETRLRGLMTQESRAAPPTGRTARYRRGAL
jgi:hypothetical protein